MSLSESCAKALGDKTYDKRKLAANEIEKIVFEYNKQKNYGQIKKLIETFSTQYCVSKDPNKRKGGLIAIAACGIALGHQDSAQFMNELLIPVLNNLMDNDTRVRYFAAESLYNIAKIGRVSIITLFPEIFSALSRLVSDSDVSVKNASELLDRLLKDIITENSSVFDLQSFIPLLRERVLCKNSFARQFTISWVSILNACPDINMIFYLNEILDGLFSMLDDNAEIQRMCETLLQQFLKNIKHDPTSCDLAKMTNILILHAQNGNHELIQFTAITWLREFLHISGVQMLPYASGIFSAILPCLAYESESKKNIKDNAILVNKLMLDLISSKENVNVIENVDLESVMQVLKMHLVHSSVNTKVHTLSWIHHFFIEAESEMSKNAGNLLPVLLSILNDSCDEVVLEVLAVIADIVKSTNEQNSEFNQLKYREFLESLLQLFREDKNFLDNRGSLIIKHLCALLNAEHIYRTMAEILSNDKENVRFASIIVRKLNSILFTSSELFELRTTLRNIQNQKSADLFTCLYKSWSHCPISTISICLLANCFQHVSDLVLLFGNLEMTVDYLEEIDKLIQLIESPIFASLRLTLVSKSADSENLANALYGLLMLIPQTKQFDLLKNRLQCIPISCMTNSSRSVPSIESQSGIDFENLKKHFQHIQKLHQHKRKISIILNS
ncbi:hypothetical protein PVAND_013628 [Polypedilum vanderplanki]|uniref:Protein VAC14 homolog n=1 Tax=Polypedilum vanderplanki TaxID=319348 RepID=A0A9J6CQA8_POLVA|nr:hypothetical protein PVAND_013628 [Polypedilum vanderplanki]